MSNTLVVKKCALTEVVDAPEFATLVADYATESAMAGMPPTNAKIPLYRQLEAAGALTAFGAFVDGKLVGFIGVLYSTLPHYGIGLAVSESYFVAKEHRTTGAGLKLKSIAEEHAREIGSPGFLITAPYGGGLDFVLAACSDYNLASRAYFKRFT